MREKQRYLIYKWRKRSKLPSNVELEDLLVKETARLFGDFGASLCGPRFRVFQLGDEGIAVKVRFEAQKHVAHVIRDFKTLHLLHVAGSATLAKKAVAKKMPSVSVNDSGIW